MSRGTAGAGLRLLVVLWAVALGFVPRSAAAYPFMIGHQYTSCVQCHVDPSGGGPLTDYGRGQAEIFMRSTYGAKLPEAGPGKIKDFAFGVVPLPKELALQGDVRGMLVPQPGNMRVILMQADLRAALSLGIFRASGSAGYVSEGGYGAWLTSNDDGGNVVSREYWLGAEVTRGLTVRAGRMNLPYGIRSEEHILFARTATRTDTNDDQQVGIDAVFGNRKIRAELMGIAGNLQVSPDDYRERGYSGLFGYAITNRLEVGVSSLFTHADLDIAELAPRNRMAHGLFGRYAPIEPIRFLAEANLTTSRVDKGDLEVGSVGYLQIDTEPTKGVHVKATGEWCDDNHSDEDAATLRATATALWFFAPHMDVRVDAMYGTLYCTTGTDPSPLGLVQLHMFL